MSDPALHIGRALGREEIETVRQLFREYADSLDVDLCFQNFDEELANLPGDYGESVRGRLLLAEVDGKAAGCVGLRALEGGEVCEMKRLYIRPACRGRGVARALVLTLVEEARRLEYRRMRLDTLPSMQQARALYERLGFVPIAPYRPNPVPGATFWELDLTGVGERR
ncbi:MAG TPA: GNAT family N-acetyltransferase [Candidatus Eisenbacteria bacterium]|nr:GNAT family N-acetyltransferase [Candidatus Eisenbacteria bacterium]